MRKLTYQKSGVDIKKADYFVKAIGPFVASNIKSCVGAFGNPFDFGPFLKKYKKPLLVSSADGVGTKLRIAIAEGIHNTIGIDLVAMNVNDVVCLGAKPLFFLDYIACGKLKPAVLKDIVKGIHKGLTESDCLLVGGETAEMPGMYRENDYDLAGFCVGVVDKDSVIDGRAIKNKDLVIGLGSSGLHSNGFSLARRALGERGVKKYSKKLLKPTCVYVKPALSLISALNHKARVVKGIAHITGGAFYNKAVKILPHGLGMILDKKSWPVPDIFKIIQDSGGVDAKEMYSVFNMGIGMVVVVDRRYARKALGILSRSKNLKSYVIGEIADSQKRMLLL